MDALTISIAIGLIVSLLFTEAFGLSAGGMIVPGYLALYFNQPLTILLTLATAFATWGAVRLLSRYAIVYGRRRIVMMILFGFLMGSLVRAIPYVAACLGGEAASESWGCLCVIGYIIPGLIALWMDRQGSIETLALLMTSSVIVRLVLIVVGVEVMV